MNFRASVYNPDKTEITEFHSIEKKAIFELFENTTWSIIPTNLNSLKLDPIYVSTSLEIENKHHKTGILIIATSDTEWQIYFKRPKIVKIRWGLSHKMDSEFLNDIIGQTTNDVLTCIEALLNEDFLFLEAKIIGNPQTSF